MEGPDDTVRTLDANKAAGEGGAPVGKLGADAGGAAHALVAGSAAPAMAPAPAAPPAAAGDAIGVQLASALKLLEPGLQQVGYARRGGGGWPRGWGEPGGGARRAARRAARPGGAGGGGGA
jgi:hypothetical protein